MSASCKTTRRSIYHSIYPRWMFSHYSLSRTFFFKKGLPLSSALFLLHFYISNHSLCLGFLPHKINTRINAHSNAKERRERKTTTTDDRWEWFFYLSFGCSSSSSSSITRLKNNIFESLFSSSRRENNGRQNKKELNEEGRRFSSASSCLLLRRVRNKSCEKRSTL